MTDVHSDVPFVLLEPAHGWSIDTVRRRPAPYRTRRCQLGGELSPADDGAAISG